MTTEKWNWKVLIYLHLIASLILFSWLLPSTRILWDSLDVNTFSLLNQSIENAPFWQNFWAITNIKHFGDIPIAICMLFVCLHYAKKNNLRYAEMLYLCLSVLFAIVISKQCLEVFLDYERLSPSLTLPNNIELATLFPTLHIRDSSTNSFPGDHAILLTLWTCFLFHFAKWRYGTLAFLLSLSFSLPRLVSGAHWLTDNFIGGLCIGLLLFAWFSASPIYFYGTKLILRLRWFTRTGQA